MCTFVGDDQSEQVSRYRRGGRSKFSLCSCPSFSSPVRLCLNSKKIPRFLRGRGFKLDRVRPLQSPVSPGTLHLVRAVSFYRSKFLDCLRGAVANSYPNVDLLWDNVITGPWGTQKCLIANPPVVVGWPRADHGGRS